MLSAMFKRDYAALRAEGLEPTPEDVVRLNALAVRVRLSASAPVVNLPRLAFLPRDSWWRRPIVLREPTIAHELWIEEAARLIDCDDDRNFAFVHAFACSRAAADLPDPRSPRGIVRAVFRFAASRLSRFTREQLSSAVEWILYGADWKAGENPTPAPRGNRAATLDEIEYTPSFALGLLCEARAIRLPVSGEEARRMTAAELEAAVTLAQTADGHLDRDSLKSRLVADYVRTRESIRERLTREKKEASAK